MSLDRRAILRAVVTDGPTLDWVKNQLRDLFAFEHPYRYLIHDNDKIFGQFGLGAIPRPPPELRLIKDAPASHGKVIARPILGGLHHDYRRAV